MTKNELEVLTVDQQEYISRLEAAILPFGAFSPSLKMADIQRLTAVDIGIGVERLRAVIDLCDEIHAREDEKVDDDA